MYSRPMLGVVRLALLGLALAVSACGGTEGELTDYAESDLAMTAVSSSSGVTIVGSVMTAVSDSSDATYVRASATPGNCLDNRAGFVKLNSGVCLGQGQTFTGWARIIITDTQFQGATSLNIKVRHRTPSGGPGTLVFTSADGGQSYQYRTLLAASTGTTDSLVNIPLVSGSLYVLLGRQDHTNTSAYVDWYEVGLEPVIPPPPPPPTPSITLSASAPSPSTVQWGSSSVATVTVQSVNGFQGNVSLSTSITASYGVVGTLSPSTVSVPAGGSASATLTLSTRERATRLTSVPITVRAMSGSLSKTKSLQLAVRGKDGALSKVSVNANTGAGNCSPPAGLGLSPVLATNHGTSVVIEAGNQSEPSVGHSSFQMAGSCGLVFLYTTPAGPGYTNWRAVGFTAEATGNSRQIQALRQSHYQHTDDVYVSPDAAVFVLTAFVGQNRSVDVCNTLSGNCRNQQVALEVLSVERIDTKVRVRSRTNSNPIQTADITIPN